MKYYITVEKKVVCGICIEASSPQEAKQKYMNQDYNETSETKLFDQSHQTARICDVEDVTKEE